MLSEEAANTNFIVFSLTRPNPRSIALEASTLTITTPIRFMQFQYFSKNNTKEYKLFWTILGLLRPYVWSSSYTKNGVSNVGGYFWFF